MKKAVLKKKVLSLLIGVLLIANTSGPAFADGSPAASVSGKDVEVGGGVLSDPVPLEDSKVRDSERSSSDFIFTDVKLDDFSKARNDLVKDSGKESAGIQAALPDLQMSSISSDSSQPFANVTPIQFHSTVSNIGSAPVSTLIFTFYIDGNYETAIQATGTLNAGEQAVLSFYTESKVGGYHTLQIIVNESRGIEESNYNNNTGVGYFQWQACISISADSVTVPFPSTMKDCSIIFNISNSGTLDANDVPIELDVNGSALYSTTTDLPAGTAKRGTLTVMFYKAGGYTFALKVDPNRIINDVDRSDNSVSSRITVLYDVETWAGRWDDPDDLDVQICTSAANEIQNGNAGADALLNATKAIRKWNGHVSGVSYGDVTVSDSDQNLDMSIQMLADNYGTEEGMAAFTIPYKYGEDGNIIAVLDPENDNCTYVRARVILNKDVFHLVGAKEQQRTITHEFGHVFGLAHPTCGDTAMMWQSKDSLKSYDIEPHDVFSLDAIY